MKYKVLFLLFIAIICLSVVKAESFVEGNFISGEYISKKKDGAIHYLTVQYLKDSQGNIVYCLEPYTKFVEGKSYTSYIGNIDGYKGLSSDKRRKISLIVYYGYGYGSRTSSKWYAITQYLIWDTVTGGDGSIYFTDTLNGKKISKYTTEISAVLNDVKAHDTKPSFVFDRTINYREGMYFSSITKDLYEVKNSTFNYTFNDVLTIKDIKEDGYFEVSKLSNYYKNKVAIFDSTSSQDLIRPGNVTNTVYRINIKVLKGNITLDIKKDDSVYTAESDFTNTCYEIYKSNVLVDSVCTGEDELIYDTVDLAYGEYEIKQISNGIGYRKDNETYKVVIDKDNQKPIVTLQNYLIRNTININKKACIDNNCNNEKDATFEIFDKNSKLVNSISTDKEGNASILLGYGSYTVKQSKGLEGYSLADDFNEKIIDEESTHYNELFNYLIKKEEKKVLKTEEKKVAKEEVVEEVLEAPDTKTDMNCFEVFISSLVQFFTSLLDKLID